MPSLLRFKALLVVAMTTLGPTSIEAFISKQLQPKISSYSLHGHPVAKSWELNASNYPKKALAALLIVIAQFSMPTNTFALDPVNQGVSLCLTSLSCVYFILSLIDEESAIEIVNPVAEITEFFDFKKKLKNNELNKIASQKYNKI